jgi:predicted metal-dependent HD superfamily phosphohydrolase
MLDEQRFAQLWRRLGLVDQPRETFAALQAGYSESHRAYHNAAHIADCLAQLDTVREMVVHPNAAEMALWFHDAIYDPKASDNEEKSAAWAVQVLSDRKAGPETVKRVANVILATKHQAVPDDLDDKIIVDIDLSILGRESEVFDRYDSAIRQEYAWVPEKDYREGRGRILAEFLGRNVIFQTPYFRSRYESMAHANLARAIARLREQ